MIGINKYIHYFEKLRRAHSFGGAPHKPILLLSVIDAIEKSFINSERIYITAELISLFKSNWKLLVQTPHIMNITPPFYHLSNEPFWQLSIKIGRTIPLSSSKSIKSFKSLMDSVNYAIIDKELFYYLSDDADREMLRNTLIAKYFPTTESYVTGDLSYLDIVAEQILNDSAIQYKKTIRQIQDENKDGLEEEIFVRNNVFKKTIPLVYEHTCSISGLKIKSDYGHSLVDACHIIPFHIEHDDTIGNGIALSPTLHRAFDNGLITISTDYKVIVSNKFKENESSNHSIKQFHSNKLILPNNELFMPRRDVLQWHNDNVFERNL